MTVHEILKIQGLFSQDIKAKIKNGQIKLNGENVRDGSLDLDLEFTSEELKLIEENKFKFEDAGNFLFKIINKDPECHSLLLGMEGIHPEVWPDLNFTNKLVEKFKKVFVLKLSKKEWIILKKKI
jgi:hypothetical protein